MNVDLRRLAGGAGLAVTEMPQVESVAVGFWLTVGGRHEPERLNGVSHFIEHLLFKGTKKRTPRQISEEVEGVGGYLNAFTSEEVTCYFAQTGRRNLETVVDVLADMLLNATFPKDEVERERGVITEEIKMYEDQPASVAQEKMQELLWPGHGLGRPLAGTEKHVMRMSRADLLGYRDRYYHGGNLWITAAGKTTADEMERLLGARLKGLKSGPRPAWIRVGPGRKRPSVVVVKKPIEQSHFSLGFLGVSQHDPRRFALRLLNVIAGENMSSRLFQVIREQHGLAYSIQSSVTCHRDTGALSIQAGVENGKLGKALSLTWKTLGQLAAKKASNEELRRAKDYSIGQMYLGLETTNNRLMWMGEGLTARGRVITPKEVETKIETVKLEDIQNLASLLFDRRRMAIAVVSPSATEEQVKQSLGLT